MKYVGISFKKLEKNYIRGEEGYMAYCIILHCSIRSSSKIVITLVLNSIWDKSFGDEHRIYKHSEQSRAYPAYQNKQVTALNLRMYIVQLSGITSFQRSTSIKLK
jgi:hypothetical protein